MSSQSTESCLTASHHYSNCSAIPPAKCCRRGRLHFCLEPVRNLRLQRLLARWESSVKPFHILFWTVHMATKFMQYMDADVQCAIWEEGMEGSPPCVCPARTGREAMSSLEELTVPERPTVASLILTEISHNAWKARTWNCRRSVSRA